MALEHKNDNRRNQGVNIEVHRYPVLEKGQERSETCMLSVYSMENGHGDSTSYADALKKAFGPALDTRMARIQEDLEKELQDDREAVGKAKTAHQREEATLKSRGRIAELKERLTNPFHNLSADECQAIVKEGRLSLEADGLHMDEDKCIDEDNNLIMHVSYRVYA